MKCCQDRDWEGVLSPQTPGLAPQCKLQELCSTTPTSIVSLDLPLPLTNFYVSILILQP